MNATTYTVDGVYTNMKLRIPPEDNIRYKYNVTAYDVSTTEYNAVLIHIVNTKGSSEVDWDGANSYVLPTTVQLPALTITAKDKVLIIVLHDGTSDDPARIKTFVNTFYTETDRTPNDRRKVYWPAGGYTETKEKENPGAVPRVVGMTIIKRTQS